MIFHDVPHGSTEWHTMRLGLATASCFDKIITPTGKPSAQMQDYANKLISEMVTGEHTENFKSYWMERGALMESDASASYEFISGYRLDRGGFITNDEMTIGVSPDRRVFDSSGKVIGCAEFKCPSPSVHIENLRRSKTGKIDPAYIPQVQGQILIGGFEFNDWFSYHPSMPPAYIRTERDESFCKKLEEALGEFIYLLKQAIKELSEIGLIVPERPIVGMHKRYLLDKEDIPTTFLTP